MIAPDNLQEMCTDGLWLAHRYDDAQDHYQIRYLDREAHDAATFITDDYLEAATDLVTLDRKQAMAAVARDNPLHFIIHSAFCASTMLARGFNLPGVSMGLKEPVLLNDIVGYRRRGASPAAVAERLDHAMHMLARPFGNDASVVVKPSNVFNALAPLALTMRPHSKAILLHAPLRVFLVSVAKKGLWCRLWCRELLEGQLSDGMIDLGFEPRDYFRMSDLQVAAVGWLAQHQLFHELAGKFGPGRIATLDSEQLTAQPEEALAAASRHFGLNISTDPVAGHSAFATHSKFGGSFDRADRQVEHAAAADAYREEIDTVLVWANSVADNAGISLELPVPLLTGHS